ncbi:hypothetical protein H8959_012135 [Pygathrix nigripes]
MDVVIPFLSLCALLTIPQFTLECSGMWCPGVLLSMPALGGVFPNCGVSHCVECATRSLYCLTDGHLGCLMFTITDITTVIFLIQLSWPGIGRVLHQHSSDILPAAAVYLAVSSVCTQVVLHYGEFIRASLPWPGKILALWEALRDWGCSIRPLAQLGVSGATTKPHCVSVSSCGNGCVLGTLCDDIGHAQLSFCSVQRLGHLLRTPTHTLFTKGRLLCMTCPFAGQYGAEGNKPPLLSGLSLLVTESGSVQTPWG